MLQLFIRNNVFIDEIINYEYKYDANLTNTTNPDIEQKTLVYPSLEKYKVLLHHNTKITFVLHNAKNVFKKYYTLDSLKSPLFKYVNSIAPEYARFIPVDLIYPEYKLNGNYCNLVGHSKPYLRRKFNSWYAFFSDCESEYMGYENIEFFFTTPDLPQLHVKQCYTMARYYETKYAKDQYYFEGREDFEHDIESLLRLVTDKGLAILKTAELNNFTQSKQLLRYAATKQWDPSIVDTQKEVFKYLKHKHIFDTPSNDRRRFNSKEYKLII